jgi:hypothetical protein
MKSRDRMIICIQLPGITAGLFSSVYAVIAAVGTAMLFNHIFPPPEILETG